MFVWELDESNFTQIMSRNVKMLSRILYSPSLKDVARLDRAQLMFFFFFFLIFHTFVCKFGSVEEAAREKILTSVSCVKN